MTPKILAFINDEEEYCLRTLFGGASGAGLLRLVRGVRGGVLPWTKLIAMPPSLWLVSSFNTVSCGRPSVGRSANHATNVSTNRSVDAAIGRW